MTDWQRMESAPKDGRTVIIAVKGRDGKGWGFHELPYLVRFWNGRWRYARHNTPLFDWHKPFRWREPEAGVATRMAA